MNDKKINISDFNAQIGKWNLHLYDSGGDKVPVVSGRLAVDNQKFMITDADGEIILVAPAGNVAFAEDENKTRRS